MFYTLGFDSLNWCIQVIGVKIGVTGVKKSEINQLFIKKQQVTLN